MINLKGGRFWLKAIGVASSLEWAKATFLLTRRLPVHGWSDRCSIQIYNRGLGDRSLKGTI